MEGVHNRLAVAYQSKPRHQEAKVGLSTPTEQPAATEQSAGVAHFAASEASATEAKDWQEERLGKPGLDQSGVS